MFFSHQITKPEVNDEESYTGPFWYFLRVMARRHGLSLLLEAPKHSEFEWMKSHDIVYNVNSSSLTQISCLIQCFNELSYRKWKGFTIWIK